MSIRDKIKAVLAARKGETLAPPVAKPASETVRYNCGHERPLREVTNTVCPTCRGANEKRRREARAARRAAKLLAEGVTDSVRAAVRSGTVGRLPDAATYHTIYDADAVEWRGTLTIGADTFEAKASGLFRLCMMLDTAYRESLTTEGGTPCPT